MYLFEKYTIPDGSRETQGMDHTVMDHLHDFEKDYDKEGGHFTLIGLDGHDSSSMHPLASRRLLAKK